MRSAVSVILSSPTPDPNMSRPDYEQTIHDHAAILILVRHLGEELSAKHFTQIFERINKVSQVKIKENNGAERTIWARYLKEYPVGNNDWGDFQTHRRLLGLITLGKCKSEIEFNEICRVHESLKVKYQSTLYDSRCIIFGANTENTIQISPPSNFRSQPIYFASETDVNPELEENITDFLSTLFWILESKRMERRREKIEKVSLLLAPFEKRDFVGLDMKSQNNRKRCAGRLTKHLGDLSLQAGLIAEAVTFYRSAMDTLKSINDWLWMGSCAEGLCAASALYLLPRIENNSPLHRNASLPLQERNVRQKVTSASQSSPESVMKMSLSLPRNVLTPEEIYKHYRDAIIHYSKYQNAGVIETEACFKGARIAVKYNSPLQAHTLLQNVIFINLTLNEEEKIQRLMSLSTLYTNIGFHRKASFYRRLTATRYVSARNPQTNWEQCYQLMLQSLPGYNLGLDPNEYSVDDYSGWPRLQRQVLQDLVVAATRLSNNGLATRHMTFLLQTMWHHMSANERLDSAMQLKKLAELCEGSPVPLVLDNGFVIPPANLLNIPQPVNFVVQNLKIHLRPHIQKTAEKDFGPFLFTPLALGSLHRKKDKNNNKLEYLWVAEEICEVILEICNPLPIDLDVSNILLLTSGIVFESIPVSVVLPGGSSNQSIILTGIPKEVGELEITGYSTHTLGVKSNCRLRYIPNIPQTSFLLEVIPALPTLQLSTCSDVAAVEQTSNATIILFAGESSECMIQLKNTSSIPVEFLEVTIDSLLEPSLLKQIIHWDPKTVQDQLPLSPGTTANLSLRLFGASNFLLQCSSLLETGSLKSSIISGPSSFPSIPSPKPTSYERSMLFSTSSFSFRSPGSSLNSYSSHLKLPDAGSKVIECQIKVRYSGGPGFKAGYCRNCSLVLYIEILSSIAITNWDVIPAETCSQFYLVLDVMNLTNSEIELNYTKTKLIQIEEGETCRIPIPIDRCPISTFEQVTFSVLFQNDDMKNESEMNSICSEHIASQVDLQWKMSQCSREGHATVNGLTLSSNMLDIVRTSPINWEILLNSTALKNSEATTHPVGEILQLGVWVHNSLSWPLVNIMLQLYLFQDYQNGTTNQKLDACVTTIGSTEVNLPKVSEHESVYHECNIVFFNTGHYKLNVQCCSLEKYTWKLIPPVEIIIVDD